jgi:hypothetical protein
MPDYVRRLDWLYVVSTSWKWTYLQGIDRVRLSTVHHRRPPVISASARLRR